jgi:hypothetical protein
MFVSGSDLTPVKEHIDKVIYGLTKWEPKRKERTVDVPGKITVEGTDYEDVFTGMNNLFLRNLWSDGLPLLPPTEKRVAWILSGTPLAADTVIGKVLPRGGIATVETLAVSLAMAGGRPEYLPVLIAATEAIVDPLVVHQVFNSTTCSTYPAVIVNGPAAKQIRIASGYGCLGPNPEYPAGAAIGRAIRLILLNVGGAIPGRGTMAIFGGANRFTNIVLAEDEDGLPAGWEPINTSYFGYPRGTNTVALHPIAGTNNINGTSVGTPETASGALHTIAGMMGVPNRNYWGEIDRFEGAPGILLMARGTARGLARFGWSKDKVKAFLWEHSKLPWSIVKNAFDRDMLQSLSERTAPYIPLNEPWSITGKPGNIMIAVAGGEQSGHSYWMQIGTSYKPVCKELKLPPNWETLLQRAEEDRER